MATQKQTKTQKKGFGIHEIVITMPVAASRKSKDIRTLMWKSD